MAARKEKTLRSALDDLFEKKGVAPRTGDRKTVDLSKANTRADMLKSLDNALKKKPSDGSGGQRATVDLKSLLNRESSVVDKRKSMGTSGEGKGKYSAVLSDVFGSKKVNGESSREKVAAALGGSSAETVAPSLREKMAEVLVGSNSDKVSGKVKNRLEEVYRGSGGSSKPKPRSSPEYEDEESEDDEDIEIPAHVKARLKETLLVSSAETKVNEDVKSRLAETLAGARGKGEERTRAEPPKKTGYDGVSKDVKDSLRNILGNAAGQSVKVEELPPDLESFLRHLGLVSFSGSSGRKGPVAQLSVESPDEGSRVCIILLSELSARQIAVRTHYDQADRAHKRRDRQGESEPDEFERWRGNYIAHLKADTTAWNNKSDDVKSVLQGHKDDLHKVKSDFNVLLWNTRLDEAARSVFELVLEEGRQAARASTYIALVNAEKGGAGKKSDQQDPAAKQASMSDFECRADAVRRSYEVYELQDMLNQLQLSLSRASDYRLEANQLNAQLESAQGKEERHSERITALKEDMRAMEERLEAENEELRSELDKRDAEVVKIRKDCDRQLIDLRRQLAMSDEQAEGVREEWRNQEAERREKYMKMIAYRWITTEIGKAFHHWNAVLMIRKSTQQILRAQKQSTARMDLKSSFISWRYAATGCKLDRKSRNREARVITRLAMLKAVNTWKRIVSERKGSGSRQQAVLKVVARRMKNFKVASAFSAFKLATEDALRHKRILRKARAKWINRAAWESMQEWRITVADIRTKRNKGRKIARRWKMGAASAAFECWRDHMAAVRRNLNIMGKLMSRWKNRALWEAFASMEAYTVQCRRHRAILDRISRKWMNRELWEAYLSWTDATVSARRQRNIIGKVAGRWANRAAGSAFFTWREFTEQCKSSAAVMNRTFRRWVNSAYLSAFNQWLSFVEEQKSAFAKISKVQARMSNLHLWKGFSTWNLHVQSMKDMRRKMLKVRGRWLHASVAAAYLTWYEFILERREEYEREAKVQAMQFKAMRRFFNSALVGGFNRWVEYSDFRIWARDTLHSIQMKWLHRELIAGWNAWVDFVDQNTGRNLYNNSLEATKEKIMRRWANRSLSGAWNAWHGRVEAARYARERMSRIMHRWENRETWTAFLTWREFADELIEARRVTRVVVGRWTRNAQAGAFNAWCEALAMAYDREEEAARRERIFEKVRRRWGNGAILGGFNKWREFCEQLQWARKTLLGIRLRTMNRDLWMGLNTWRENVYAMMAERTLKHKVAARWQYNGQATGFFAWLEYVDICHELRERERKSAGMKNRAIRKFANHALAMGMEGWKVFLVRRREARRILRSVDMKLRNRVAWQCFLTWTSNVTEMRKNRYLMKKVQGRWLHKNLTSGWMPWYSFHLKAVKRRHMEEHTEAARRRALKHFLNRAVLGAFNAWIQYTENRAHSRAVLYSIQSKWANRDMWTGFLSWKAWAEEVQHNRAVMSRVSGRFRSNGLARGWASWWEYIDWVMETEAEEERKANVSRRAMGRWLHNALTSGFSAWVDFTEWSIHERTEKQRQDNLKKKMVMRWQRSALFQGFGWWYKVVEMVREAKAERKRTAAKRNRAVRRWSHRGQYGGFSRWKEYYTFRKNSRVTVGRIAKKWSHRDIWLGFLSWQEYTALMQHKRSVSNKVIGRWVSNAQSAAFQRWMDMVSEAEEERIETERKMNVSNKVMRRWCQKGLTMGFNQWFNYVQTMIESREILGRVSGRWHNRKLFAVFNTWQENAADNARERRILVRSMGRWSHQALAGAFSQWADTVASEVAQRNFENDQEAVLHRLDRRFARFTKQRTVEKWMLYAYEKKNARALFSKVRARAFNGKLWSGFAGWMEFTEQCVHNRGLMSRVMSHWQRKALHLGFNTWLDTLEFWREEQYTRQRKENIKRRAMHRWHGNALVYAWDEWLAAVEVQKEERFREKRKWNIKNKMMQRWVNRALSSGFEGWVDYVSRRVWARDTMAKVGGRMKNYNLWQGFDSWLAAHEELQQRKNVSRKVVGRWVHNATAGAWAAWLEGIDIQREERDLVRRQDAVKKKTLRKFIQSALWRGFSQWQDACGLQNAMRLREAEKSARYRRVMKHWIGSSLSRGFCGWRDYVLAKAACQDVLQRVAYKLLNRRIAIGLETWVHTVQQRKHDRYGLRRATSLWLKSAMGMGFRTWFCNVAEIVDTRNKRNRAARRWANSGLASGFDRWKDVHLAYREYQASKRRREYVLNKTMKKMTHGKINAAFNKWAGVASQNIYIRSRLNNVSRRMKNRQVATGFVTWLDTCQTRWYEEGVKQKVVQRWIKGALARAYNAWVEFSEWSVAKRKQDAITMGMRRKSLRAWRRHGLYVGWSSWVQYMEDRRQSQETMRKLLLRWQNRDIVRGWDRWLFVVDSKARNTNKLNRAMNYMKKRNFVAGFNSWREFIKDVQQARVWGHAVWSHPLFGEGL